MNITINKIQYNQYKLQQKQENKEPAQSFAQIHDLPSVHPNKYLVNFNGLTKELKKKAYISADNIKDVMDNHPKSNGIVGNLPSEWINKIPLEKREESIKNIYKAFNKAVNICREQDIFFGRLRASHKITKVLRKTGVFAKGEKINLDFIDSGCYGSVYKLKGIGQNNEYVIKIFQNQEIFNSRHGNYAELNRAVYWQKNAGKNTQRVRFYFGDMKAGYMINKYIDEDIDECKKSTNMKRFGLEGWDDYDYNLIKGYCIDWGGIGVESEILASNKTARYVYKKIQNAKDKEADFNYFLNKNDKIVNAALAEALVELPENVRDKYFEKLAKNADLELKKILAKQIRLLSDENRLKYLELLSKDAEKELLEKLKETLLYIPKQNQFAARFLLGLD